MVNLPASMRFSQLKNRFLAFMASILPASTSDSSNTDATHDLPFLKDASPMPIAAWVELVIRLLQDWSPQSVKVWSSLNHYQLKKAYHCKTWDKSSRHEFIICEFQNVNQQRGPKLELRFDRAPGDARNNSISSFSSVDSTPDEPTTSAASSPDVSRHALPPSSSSSSFPSVSNPFDRMSRRISENSLIHSSHVSSNHCLAADTVAKINGHPLLSPSLKTIEFTRAPLPSLWFMMILVYVVHNERTTYKLMDSQCYWFADTIFGLLEVYGEERGNSTTTLSDKHKAIGQAFSTGIHSRNELQVREIWHKFLKEQEQMNERRNGFVRDREEARRKETEERELQLADLMRKERDEWKKVQEEREHHLMSQMRQEQALLIDQVQKEREERKQLQQQIDKLKQLGGNAHP